jgi:hypothetical protein
MSSHRIAYTPRSDATPEAELNALASVYSFILDCHAKKKATRSGGLDDAEESKNDRTDTASIHG